MRVGDEVSGSAGNIDYRSRGGASRSDSDGEVSETTVQKQLDMAQEKSSSGRKLVMPATSVSVGMFPPHPESMLLIARVASVISL